MSRGLKVVAFYFGNRQWPDVATPKEQLPMLKFFWERETSLDQGFPVDTLLVNNRDLTNSAGKAECEKFLNSLSGKKTPNGTVTVVERPNNGLSFGAFNFAFQNYKNKYDYWMFLEDDCIVVKPGVFGHAVGQLKGNPKLGCVSLITVVKEDPEAIKAGVTPYCQGGAIVSRTEVLSKVSAGNRGSLPCWPFAEKVMKNHRIFGEFAFTNQMLKHNFLLEELKPPEENVLVIWGLKKKVLRLVTPYGRVTQPVEHQS